MGFDAAKAGRWMKRERKALDGQFGELCRTLLGRWSVGYSDVVPRVAILVPQTFMNESGRAVSAGSASIISSAASAAAAAGGGKPVE